MTRSEAERLRRLLCGLQDHIQERLLAARRRGAARLARVAAVTAADTIYAIDRVSEEAILGWFEAHWPAAWPVEIVMEGLEGEATTFPTGTPVARTRFKCILDPIDGTRGLMYDKRPAWILAGIALQRGPRTSLRDIRVAAMTELPVSKQTLADQFSAVTGGGVVAVRRDLARGRRTRLAPRPSAARDFAHCFASFARFFTPGKVLTAQLEEAFWHQLVGPDAVGSPRVFDDQYISTGGQLAELLSGHDRLLADLRPLVFARLGLTSSLVCHPYDICTELILREAGGIVERPEGGRLRAPLDTTTPVAWVGYANPALARLARPVLRDVLRQL